MSLPNDYYTRLQSSLVGFQNSFGWGGPQNQIPSGRQATGGDDFNAENYWTQNPDVAEHAELLIMNNMEGMKAEI